MLETFRRPALIIGVSASLLLHALASVILYTAAPATPEPAEEPILVDFDMDVAPPPPEAEMPSAEDEPVAPPAPAEVAQPARPEETVPAPEPEPEPEPEAIATHDAAPPERDAGPADAMPADAGPGQASDAGHGDAGADEVLAAAPADAGADAGAGLTASAPAQDAAPVAASAPGAASDAGPGNAGEPTPGEAQAAGTGTGEVNLLAYLPPGDVISVLVRFDRLRGKPWAAHAEAILAPMPDYRSLVGDRDVKVSDLFDFLVISTPEPRDVSATTLVGRTRLAGPEVRSFINHPAAPVSWYTGRGGPAGKRTPSQLVHPTDKRVFVLPQPGWVVLAQPRYLGVLPEPAAGDIDMAMASQADLPAWLARAPSIDELTAAKEGPVLMLTIQGMLPPRLQTPYLGEFDTPRRLTLAIATAPVGFIVRGAMLFENEDQAKAFIAALIKAKSELTTTPMGKLLLNRFHVFHALNGLSFKRNQAKVAFSTSISGNDARGLLERTAVQVRTYFEAQREPTKRLRRPRPDTEPMPATPASPAPASPAPAPATPAPGG